MRLLPASERYVCDECAQTFLLVFNRLESLGAYRRRPGEGGRRP
jgi:hypothetical protein